MANILLSETPQSAVSGFNKTKLTANTATGFISAVFSSLQRVAGPADAPKNFNISDLDSPGSGTRQTVRGFLRGRRPFFGLLFPRGYYNR